MRKPCLVMGWRYKTKMNNGNADVKCGGKRRAKVDTDTEPSQWPEELVLEQKNGEFNESQRQ